MTISLSRHWEARAVSKDRTAGWDTEFPKPLRIFVSA
jgi:hypothetical protein